MNNNKGRISMPMLDKVVSLLPFVIMTAVSVGGMLFSYTQNKKIDAEEKKNQ